MAEITIDTDKLRQYATRIGNVSSRITSLDSRINSLLLQIEAQGTSAQLNSYSLSAYIGRLTKCRTYLESTAIGFEAAETELLKYNPSSFDSMIAALGALKIIGSGTASGSNGAHIRFGYVDEETTASLNYGKYKDKKILGDKDHLNVQIKQDEKPWYQKNADEKWYKDPKLTLLEVSAKTSKDISLVDCELSGENDFAEGSIEAKFLTAGYTASASAGLYVYEKKADGTTKRVFSPGVSAEIGASASVLSVDTSGRVGLGEDNNLLGVYGKAEADVLTAEAKGKVSINKNELYAGVSAEADLVKVSASAGVSVLGADVGVSGSLKVGVGAHAEVGITDGKLKIDIGAAVGVGFDLGLEVDVSGVVDAVTDVSESILNAASEVADAVSSTVSKAADAVSSTASKVKELASGVSSVFKSWFK